MKITTEAQQLFDGFNESLKHKGQDSDYLERHNIFDMAIIIAKDSHSPMVLIEHMAEALNYRDLNYYRQLPDTSPAKIRIEELGIL